MRIKHLILYFNEEGNIEILANNGYSINKYKYSISSKKRDTLTNIANSLLIGEYDKITISKPDNRPFVIQENASGNSSIIPLDAPNSFQFPWHDNQSISIARYGDNYLSADDLRLYIWNESNSKLSQSDLAKLFDKNFRFGKSKEILNNPDMLSDERIQQLRNHLSVYPDDFDSWNELGKEYFEVDSLMSAIASYQNSLKLNPDQNDIYYKIGECYSFEEEFKKAIPYYHQAKHLAYEDSIDINFNLAFCYFQLSNCDSTFYYLKGSVDEGESFSSENMYIISVCFMNVKQYGKLEELIEFAKNEIREFDALQDDEGLLYEWNVLLAYLQLKKGQFAEAEKILRKISLEKLISPEYYHFVYACYYAVMNNKELMIRNLEKLVEDNIRYKKLIEFEYEESFKKYKDDDRVKEIFEKFSDFDSN